MIDFVTAFMEQSPFGTGVGLRLDHIEADRVRVVLPYREAVTTIADVVHGGAISTLVDVAATRRLVGGRAHRQPARRTIGLTVDFLRAARGADLVADARVLRRGRSVCFCEVDVRDGDDLVAKGLVSYKLG